MNEQKPKQMRTLAVPPRLDCDGLLVGWSLETEHKRTPIGFSFGDPAHGPDEGFLDPVIFDGDGHLMTIATVDAGKELACIVPAL
ncbi:MAG: hypothetical protein D6773_10065, partial [Alphaproteobacteria bacterium]